MHSPQTVQLRRRLRARARRAKVLRRRVAATAITLFLAFWTMIYAAGGLGRPSTGRLALLASRTSSKSTPSDSVSSSAGPVSTPAVITGQS